MVIFIFGQENIYAAVMDAGVGEITVTVILKHFVACVYGGGCTADDVCQVPLMQTSLINPCPSGWRKWYNNRSLIALLFSVGW